MHAGDIVRIFAHAGDDVFFGNRERHRPGRIEIDRCDRGRDHGRRPIGLADDDDVAVHDLAALDRLGERGRQIHHHVALGEGEIGIGQAIERGRELAQALLHRHIESGERARAERAGFRQAVAGLEALERRHQCRVEHIAAELLGRQVIGDGEPLAQQRDVRAAGAGRNLGILRDGRPAAAHLDGGIAQHGGSDALRGALLVGRLRRLRDQGGRQRPWRGRCNGCRFRHRRLELGTGRGAGDRRLRLRLRQG